jgi:hypothetical protein
MSVSQTTVVLEDCEIIAAALDFFICNSGVSEDVLEQATDLLLKYDIEAEELEDRKNSKEIKSLLARDKVTGVEENLISVDFSNKTV